VQPFLHLYLAEQEMGGREAWVELQYFTPLRNGFAVLAGVVDNCPSQA